LVIIITLSGLSIYQSARAADAQDATVDYLRDVKPIFAERCFACHGALSQESELRLDTAAQMLAGGDSGPAIDVDDPAASLLLERVSDPDESSRMPPEGEPLSVDEIELLRRWIAAGAAAPEDEQPEVDPRDHWSFRPIVRPEVPVVDDEDWSGNPIDRFIAARHAAEGLTASPPAANSTLLRRLYLDLIGLPPSRDELRAFLADEAPDAYERVVDDLLARPQYGERWGRHWMDVWRYSDWYGRRNVPDVMNSYPQIWRWRDWIVGSLNDDRGYDEMVRQMLAADELCPTVDENIVATGFLVRNWFKWNYNQWMKDNVEHVGKAFLGLTLNCCHCHDHKYDPISQEEYFAFRAIFEPLELRQDRVPGLPDPGEFKKYVYAESYGPIAAGMIRVFDERLDAETYMYEGGDARKRIEGRGPVEPGVPAILGGRDFEVTPVNLPAEASNPGLKMFVQEEELAKCRQAISAADAALAEARAAAEASEDADAMRELLEARVESCDCTCAVSRADLASLEARIAAEQIRFGGDEIAFTEQTRTASRLERTANIARAETNVAAAQLALAESRALNETDEKRAEKIKAAEAALTEAQETLTTAQESLADETTDYTPLTPHYPRQSTGRRAALAHWITSEQNPLTARVAANHIWARHFGQPLVVSVANFGRNGDAPTHRELLDWLASELMEHDWSMKHLHRLITTSHTYRQASGRQASSRGAADATAAELDPDNRYLWRFNTLRMEAEVVRDSVLYVAGELDLTMGGQEIDHTEGLTSKRRSMYFSSHGEKQMQMLELFDGPNVGDCYRRTSSIVPQQALALVNNSLTLGSSRVLAKRLYRGQADGGDVAGFDDRLITVGFEQVLSRTPSAAELDMSRRFLGQQAELFAGQSREPIADESQAAPEIAAPAIVPAERAYENFIHALINHNDFVTIR
jgi:mono/diheme cytochrome c family protein